MISFGKNKDEKSGRKQRYDFEPVENDEIVDILLSNKDETSKAPLAAALVEPEIVKDEEVIYDLVVNENENEAKVEIETEPEVEVEYEAEAEIKPEVEAEPEVIAEADIEEANDNNHSEVTAQQEAQISENLNQQVESLSREYEAINQQLEKSLIVANQLSQQLTESKKTSVTNYVAMGIAGLSFLLAIGAIVASVNMERDTSDLKNSLNTLIQQTALEKKQLAEKNAELESQIAQLDNKIASLFATDNLDNVLQVTKELKKQVHALADKNLAMLNNRPETNGRSAPTSSEKVASSSLKSSHFKLPDETKKTVPVPVETPKPATVHKEAENKPVVKSEINKAADTKSNDKKTDSEKNSASGHWSVAFGTFRDQNLAKIAAAKLKKSGAPVEVVQIKQKKQVWYRVMSSGFKTKKEAQNHAEQVKKDSGFSSAMVTKGK